MAICDMTATELSSLLLEKKVSALELTEEFLARAKEKNTELGAYITISESEARKSASLADGLFLKNYATFLTGLPFGVKDNICTSKIRTTCASRILENYVPTYNATVVKRVHSNCGVLIGKTNLDEFAIGAFGENSALAICKNPINQEFSPGGSSSGSAVAVKSGLCAWALGSDTGGSVRLPASFCGCVGFKPTYGAIPRYGLISFASSMDTVGLVTRTAQDASLIAPHLFGKDERDMTSLDVADTADSLSDLNGITFSFSEQDVGEADGEIKETVIKAVRCMENLGAKRIDKSVFSSNEPDEIYNVLSCAEAMSNLARYDGIKYGRMSPSSLSDTGEKVPGLAVTKCIEFGNFVLKDENYKKLYESAALARQRISSEISSLLSEADIILSPLCDFRVPRRGEISSLRPDKFTVAANFAGVPAISVPLGKDCNGMPISVQLMSGKCRDAFLLQVAALLQKEARV